MTFLPIGSNIHRSNNLIFPDGGDPFFANVALLIGPYNEAVAAGSIQCFDKSIAQHAMEGTSGAGTTWDVSLNGPFGALDKCYTLIGTSQGIRPTVAGAAPSLVFGTNDYTWEGMFFFPNITWVGAQVAFVNGDSGGAYVGHSIIFRSAGGFPPFAYNQPNFTVAIGNGALGTQPPAGVWHYVATSRNSGIVRFYRGVVGVDTPNAQFLGTLGGQNQSLGVNSTFGLGAGSTGGLVGAGRGSFAMANIRLTNGVGRYPVSCPMPTTQFPIA